MTWIVKRAVPPRYLGAYDWVHTPVWAARFSSPRVARRARDVAREKNSGVRVFRLKTINERIHLDVRKGWGIALDRARELEDFARNVATNFDHDEDAHRHNTFCRVCEAEKLLGGHVPTPSVCTEKTSGAATLGDGSLPSSSPAGAKGADSTTTPARGPEEAGASLEELEKLAEAAVLFRSSGGLPEFIEAVDEFMHQTKRSWPIEGQKEPWTGQCSHDPGCATELEHSLVREDPCPSEAPRCPYAGATQPLQPCRFEEGHAGACSFTLDAHESMMKSRPNEASACNGDTTLRPGHVYDGNVCWRCRRVHGDETYCAFCHGALVERQCVIPNCPLSAAFVEPHINEVSYQVGPELCAGCPFNDSGQRSPKATESVTSGEQRPDKALTEEDPGACLSCGQAYELVRPGKSQPTCDCHERPCKRYSYAIRDTTCEDIMSKYGEDIDHSDDDALRVALREAYDAGAQRAPRSETAVTPELEALRKLGECVADLIAANDAERGLDRPRPDIAWRNVKWAHRQWVSLTGGTDGQ